MPADLAPDLHQALQDAATAGLSHLDLDGKTFASDRCRPQTPSVKGRPIDACYAGRTGAFGGKVQALCEPGHVHDLDAARRHVLPAVHPPADGLPILADPGYRGAGHGVIVPFASPTDGNALPRDVDVEVVPDLAGLGRHAHRRVHGLVGTSP